MLRFLIGQKFFYVLLCAALNLAAPRGVKAQEQIMIDELEREGFYKKFIDARAKK
ncbi:MAG: hypothetical protein ACREOR_11105 [Candidatus Binatia bacterium]